MPQEVNPRETSRAAAFGLCMNARNPMVTLVKTLDVGPLVRFGRRRGLKFNMLMVYCIGRAAAQVKEFFLLPVGDRLFKYDALAVNTIVRNRNGGVSSCDLLFSEDLDAFSREYLEHTALVSESCRDRDLSDTCMVIGTSAIVETEIDGAVGVVSGEFNNPFLLWGRYRKKLRRYALPVSFQFHHTQMDGAHAGRFLELLQREISGMKGRREKK